MKSNGHRFTVERKNPFSLLFSHLTEHGESNSTSFCVQINVPIEIITHTGSDEQNLIKLLRRETFYVDTLGSLESTGINKNRREAVFEFTEIIYCKSSCFN